jgi:hypothetical protein
MSLPMSTTIYGMQTREEVRCMARIALAGHIEE